MKQGWQIKTLDELCEIFGRIGYRGYTKNDLVPTPEEGAITLSPTNIVDGELHYDKCSYITWEKYEESPEIMVFEGDIVLVKTASIGKCALVRKLPHKATLNPQFVVLKKLKANNQYLTYFLQSPIAQQKFQEYAIGTAIPTFSQKKLGTLEVPVPSISEQQRIVALLDAEFAKIDALKANAKKNLQNAKALFQAALKKELEPKEGWMVKTLKEIGLTQTGTTPKTSVKENYGNYIPFIKPADVNIDGLGNLNYDNEGLSEQGAKCGRVFEANSILMVCIGATIGKVGYAKQKVSSNQQINVLTPNDGYDCKFLYYCMASPRFQFEVIKEGESAKATLPIINKTKWEGLSIAIPSKSAQHSIVARLDALNEKCKTLQANYEKTLNLCDDLKQALLKKAFNGEI